MLQGLRSSRTGFTLVELAIVLSVVGLLSAGLWRLMSSGNQQLRDQNAASMQAQLISSVKAYLATSQAQIYLQAHNTGAAFNLPLPTVNSGGVCTINASFSNFCQYLPPGFINTTTNSYSQVFTIQVLGDGTGAAAAPSTYSFMILTSGGSTIPDSSGGRITASIGSDGGFVFSTLVCGTAPSTNWACGAYGSWTISLGTYGFGAPATGGYVASRTYVSPEQDSNQPWLARSVVNNDPTYSLNTMVTNLYVGGTSPNNTINLAKFGATSGGGTLNAEGGTINMENSATTTGGGSLNMDAGTINMNGGIVNLQGGAINGSGTSYIAITNAAMPSLPPASFSTGCSIATNPACTTAAISVPSGDISVPAGEVNANTIYAGTFIYQTSDMRLKTNVYPMQNSLDDMMKLKPVHFTLKSNQKDSFGFIAQDLEKIYPQLVSENQGHKFVNYDGLISPMVDAIQQLKQENNDLRRQLNDQAARQEKLEGEIRSLQKNP